MDKVNKRVRGSVVCLTTDGLNNIKNDSIVNYMSVSPDASHFLESISTGQQEHNYQLIVDEIARVIRRYDKTTFAGVVTDNNNANKNVWMIHKERFPSMYLQSCCFHGLHMLVKNIFGVTKTRKAGMDMRMYPDGYPFKDRPEFIEKCKNVIKFFHNHHVPKARLRDLQQTSGACSLMRPALTR